MSSILIATGDFFPRIGGVSIMTHFLAEEFVDCGYSVTVVTPSYGQVIPEFANRYKLQHGPGLLRKGTRSKGGKMDTAASREKGKSLEEIVRGNGDVAFVLLMTLNYQAWEFAKECRGQSVRFFVFCHGFDVRKRLIQRDGESLLKQWMKNVFRSLVSYDWKKSLQSADSVFTNSLYTASLVREATGDHARVVVAGCGLPLESYHRVVALADREGSPSDREWPEAERAFLAKHDFLIVYVGRLLPHKNVDRIIRGLADRGRWGLAVVGSGPSEAELKQLAGDAGVTEQVYFAGNVPEEAKWQWLAEADVFCLLSVPLPSGEVEGFGIVLLEAAAAGTAVVVSGEGGTGDVVRDGRDGLVVPERSTRALVDALDRMEAEPAFRRACVESLRGRIENEFNWAQVAEVIRSHAE